RSVQVQMPTRIGAARRRPQRGKASMAGISSGVGTYEYTPSVEMRAKGFSGGGSPRVHVADRDALVPRQGHRHTVGREGDAVDRTELPVEAGSLLVRGRVPADHGVVGPAGGERSAVRREGHGADELRVPPQGELARLPPGQVPYDHDFALRA